MPWPRWRAVGTRPKAECVAGRLWLDAQADLLAGILRLTLPKGVGPFVEKLTALGGILHAEDVQSDTEPALGSGTASHTLAGRGEPRDVSARSKNSDATSGSADKLP